MCYYKFSLNLVLQWESPDEVVYGERVLSQATSHLFPLSNSFLISLWRITLAPPCAILGGAINQGFSSFFNQDTDMQFKLHQLNLLFRHYDSDWVTARTGKCWRAPISVKHPKGMVSSSCWPKVRIALIPSRFPPLLWVNLPKNYFYFYVWYGQCFTACIQKNFNTICSLLLNHKNYIISLPVAEFRVQIQ